MNDNRIPIETPKIMVVNEWSLQLDEESKERMAGDRRGIL
jgi:hypothetical protein